MPWYNVTLKDGKKVKAEGENVAHAASRAALQTRQEAVKCSRVQNEPTLTLPYLHEETTNADD